MTQKTLNALRGSIKKWKGILAGKIENRGASNCPLCEMFNTKVGCFGCPVKEKTDRNWCSGTPYEKWKSDWKTADTPEKKEIALKEIKFLESLLPSKKAKKFDTNNSVIQKIEKLEVME